eukprot:GSMAST32.ASY1.ANO1.286.1 assembled CDS
MSEEAETEVIEEFLLTDDEDEEFNYDDVPDHTFSSDEDDDEDLETALRSLNRVLSETAVKPSVVDDFIRNFLIKMGMMRALESFNTEWYQLQMRKNVNKTDLEDVPDIYLQNQKLNRQIQEMSNEVSQMKIVADKAQGTWDKFRKERDFHRMHHFFTIHKRVVQEKDKLVKNIRRLKKHYAGYEPALKSIRQKYEQITKAKMLLTLERDRLLGKNKTLEEALLNVTQNSAKGKKRQENKNKAKDRKGKVDSRIPTNPVNNPYVNMEFDASDAENFCLQKTFKGHLNPVAAMAFHPKKPILATVSDDETWKMWSAPNGELIMSGEGHKDWLAGVDFHPSGSQLATCSGDSDVKLWDFVAASCSHTFTEHTQAVWDVSYHHAGDFIASCSMDHTSKLWDLHTQKCRQTFRGHVYSVNSIIFQPFTNNICTASGDKTVSIWDIRSGLCVQTFYGHMNSCNSVAFTLNGQTIASCVHGIVKFWDIRTIQQIGEMDAGPHPANKVDFDRSGEILAVASDDATIKIFETKTLKYVKELQGHEDAVQAVLFDPTGKFLVSAGSDCTFRIWS